jgi:hypothetical protein
MLPSDIRIGWVFRYSYLWHSQHREGREESDKDRPCLVLAVVMVEQDGSRVVRVLPITHSPPSDPNDALEIPAAVKQRLRLDPEPSWIVLTESNRFVWPGPDLRPIDRESGYYGPISSALFAEVKRRFVALARNARHTDVRRTT